MAPRNRVTPAKEGTYIELMGGPYYAQRPIAYTVAPKCDQDAGRWICVTHDKVFVNNSEKDSHISGNDGTARGATHVLAWFCAHHGPEVP